MRKFASYPRRLIFRLTWQRYTMSTFGALDRTWAERKIPGRHAYLALRRRCVAESRESSDHLFGSSIFSLTLCPEIFPVISWFSRMNLSGRDLTNKLKLWNPYTPHCGPYLVGSIVKPLPIYIAAKGALGHAPQDDLSQTHYSGCACGPNSTAADITSKWPGQ